MSVVYSERQIEREELERSVVQACSRMRRAAHQVCEVFLAARRDPKSDLTDLKWHFWVAIGRVSAAAAEVADPCTLRKIIVEAQPLLGAPGDFGYGQPTGDSLCELYRAASAHADACKKLNAVLP